jgi:hypothetical protein
VSNESSAADVYVRPFSATGRATGGAKWVISGGGALNAFPRWSSSGAQLFFARISTFDMHAVDIDTRDGFRAGTPRRIFAVPPPVSGVGWAPVPDGKFLFVTTPDGGKTAPFTVVLNWAAALAK